MSGLSSIDYTVTVSAEIGITEKQTNSASFTLTLKNPCIDTNFVTMSPFDFGIADQRYELYEHDPTGFQFSHNPFIISTLPIDHTLCGDITYTSTFMTAAISDLDPVADPINDAVGYDPTSNTYTVYSEDFNLLGIHPYTLTATLTQYTSVT